MDWMSWRLAVVRSNRVQRGSQGGIVDWSSFGGSGGLGVFLRRAAHENVTIFFQIKIN